MVQYELGLQDKKNTTMSWTGTGEFDLRLDLLCLKADF